MEILAIFSILNSLFLLKMEILTVFSILNAFFLPELKISTVFSILTSLFIPKMEILTVFSILSHFLFPDFWLYNKFGAWKNSSPGFIFLYIQLFRKPNSLLYLLSFINISQRVSVFCIYISKDKSSLFFFELHTIIFQFFDNTYSYTI